MFHFDKQFFEKYQRQLLFIANKWYLGWLLGLNRLPKDLKLKRIDKITPNSIHHIIKTKFTKSGKFSKQKIIAEFFVRPRFAEALAYNLSPFCYFQELRSRKFCWRFSSVGLAYILLFGLLGKFAGVPFAFMATTTNYPAGAGQAVIRNSGSVWETILAASAGDSININPSVDDSPQSNIDEGTYYDRRVLFPEDASAIPDGATISDATFNIYSEFTTSQGGANAFARLVQTTQADPTSPVVGDFDQFGTTAGAGDFSMVNGTSGWAVFTLNATGLSWISKTTWTLLGLRTGFDINVVAPTGLNKMYCRLGGYTGTDYDPYLSVTYSATNIKSVNGLAIASVKSVNGLAIASVKSVNGLL